MNLLVDDVGTLRKHIKSPFRPSLNMAKKSVERYERDLYHESDLHGDSKPHASPSGFIQLLAIMMIPICVQCTKPPDLTAFSVNPVSVNTGTTGDTVMPKDYNYGQFGEYASTGERLFAGCSYTSVANGFKLWTKSGELKGVSQGLTYCRTIVLKDPLKIWMSTYLAYGRKIFTLQTIPSTSSIYTISTFWTYSGTNDYGVKGIDVPNSTYIVHAGFYNIIKIDVVNTFESLNVALQQRTEAVYDMMYLSSIDAFVVGKYYYSIPIVRRSDFSPIRNPAYTDGLLRIHFRLDNMRDDVMYAYSTGYWITKIDILNDPTNLLYLSTLYAGTYGAYNNILNFGPYQYVVTMPSWNAVARLLFINKISFTGFTNFASYITNSTNTMLQANFMGWDVDDGVLNDKYYFSYVVYTQHTNFQTYYLLVDNCTSRSAGSICDTCADETYRTNLTAGNLCIGTESFPPLHGIQTSTQSIQPCQRGCLNCLMDNTLCTSCDSGSNYELTSSNMCEPVSGYGWDSTNQILSLCTETGCINCSIAYQTCTACHLNYTISGSSCNLKSGLGFDTTNGGVRDCDSLGCTNCAQNYLVCTQCSIEYNLQIDNTCKVAISYGPNLLLGGIATQCQAQGCSDCSTDHTICNACYSQYVLNTSTLCYPKAGFGYDTNNGNRVRPCSIKGCNGCFTNYLTCSSCTTTYYQYIGSTCFLKSGYGYNTSDYSITTCQSKGCTDCMADFKVCVACGTDYDLLNEACAVVPGKGYDLADVNGLLIKSCASTGCLTCSSNYLICTSCGAFYDLLGGICRLKDGLGVNTTDNNAVVSCNSTGCIDCRSDYLLCTQCSSQYSVQPDATCDLAPGMGYDTSDLSIRKCFTVGCTSCKNNYLFCLACSENGTLTNNYCKPHPGFGLDSKTNSISQCNVSNCTDCADNYEECGACHSNYTLVNSTYCERKPCTHPACTSCPVDIDTCRSCDTSIGYVYNDDTCIIKPKDEMKLETAYYDLNDKIVKVRFLAQINQTIDFKKFEYVIEEKRSDYQENLELDKDISITTNDTSIFISFHQHIIADEAHLTIYNTSSKLIIDTSNTTEFKDFPLKIKGIYFYATNTPAQKAAEVSSQVVGGVSTTILIGAMFSNPPMALFMVKALSNLAFLSLLNTPLLVYPSLILTAVRKLSPIPFSYRNPMNRIDLNFGCQPNRVFEKKEVGCNILANYGEDLIVIYCTLLINVIISIICKTIINIISNKKSRSVSNINMVKSGTDSETKESKSQVILASIQKAYGVDYTINSLDGMQLEILSYCFINLVNSKTVWQQLIGVFISVKFVLYYALVEYLRFRLGVLIWKKIKMQSNTRIDSKSQEGDEIGDSELEKVGSLSKVVKLETMPFSRFGSCYTTYIVPKKMVQILMPLIGTLRNLLQSIAMVLTSNISTLQLGILLIIEILYLYYLISTNVKASRLEYYLDVSLSLMNISYIFITITSLSVTDRYAKEEILGATAALLLILMVVANMSYVLFTMASSLLKCFQKKKLTANQLPKNMKKVELLSPSKSSGETLSKNALKSEKMAGSKLNFRMKRKNIKKNPFEQINKDSMSLNVESNR